MLHLQPMLEMQLDSARHLQSHQVCALMSLSQVAEQQQLAGLRVWTTKLSADTIYWGLNSCCGSAPQVPCDKKCCELFLNGIMLSSRLPTMRL